MAQPVWATDAGSLGTIAEGLFFNVTVSATDPDGGAVTYSLVAGSLPEGIQVKTNGTIEGIPLPYSTVSGVPTEVAEDVTSKFTIRATSSGRINDRTFSLTVTGQDVPQFVTAAGSLGDFYDGDVVDIDIEFSDDDPGDTVTVTVDSGELPPGLTLSSSGNISGYILPVEDLPLDATSGYDASDFDRYQFDFRTRSVSRNYQFTLKISDGKDYNIRTFTIFVASRDSLTADTTDFTADDTSITLDATVLRKPVITNYPTDGELGTFRHDNFFAYQVQAIDLDGDEYEFDLLDDSADLPDGLIFDTATGWLRGYLPDQGATEEDYEFSIAVRKIGRYDLQSAYYTYKMSVIGDLETGITWLTGTKIDSTEVYRIPDINNGDISELSIKASTTAERTLLFRIESGSLPPGLELQSSGNITGRVSFDTFSLDAGTTTFDTDRPTRLISEPTNFDSDYQFKIEVYTEDGLVSVFRTFKLFVNREYNTPYENVYIQATPIKEDRDLLESIVQNGDVFPAENIYRGDDPYFGIAEKITYVHAYSLDAASLTTYVTALAKNHYRKKLVLGEIKTARALDDNGDVLYEVVYADIVDTGVNKQNESPAQSIISSEGTVYPNSLQNMRTQVVDTVRQTNTVLPRWMTSKQENGRVLGFTRAWVIAYTTPGSSARIAYNIVDQFDQQLNTIDFDVDRYILDRTMTHNYTVFDDSTENGEWDSVDNYEYTDEYNKYLVFPKQNILG